VRHRGVYERVDLVCGGYHPAVASSSSSSYIQNTSVDQANGSPTSAINILAVAPDAPTTVVGTSNADSQTVVTWTAPGYNGGAAVTGYAVQYSSDGGSTWTTASSNTSSTNTNYTITGLTNGTSYVIEVAAINASGTGAWSLESAPAIPSTVPDQPAAPSVSVGDATLTVNWTAPADGGSPITGYQVMLWGVVYNFDATTFSHTFTADPVNGGIKNGAWYHPVVAAFNANGLSLYSLQSAQVFPGFLPGAPSSVLAVLTTLTSATVTWPFAPSSSGNGGWNINNYIVTVKLNGTTVQTINTNSGNIHQIVVSGLITGLNYTFTVQAVSPNGASDSSTTSSALLIAMKPGAVTGLKATAGSQQVALAWNAAAANGAAVSYTVTLHQGATTTVLGTTSSTSYAVTGLTTGLSYWFTVQASNVVGSSTAVNSSTVNVL
jgi:Fibronectin type III domain